MSEEKALDKIDIQSELKTLSPIEARSIELKKQADEIEISDKETYKEAKKVRRELISHRTSTKDLRLTFTRKLDNLKDQFIKKQDEVLEPSIAGEETIKSKIASWEREEQERKEAEEKRMQAIVDTFKMPDHFDRKTATVEDVNRVRAYIKAELSLLAPNDRTKVAVKTAVAELRQKLDDEQAYILERIQQEEERERLQQERIKMHSEQLESIGFPTNDTVFGFRISGMDLTKSEEEWTPLFEQAKKRLEMQKAKDAKGSDEPLNTSYPDRTATPVAEPAKESSAPVKESEPVPSDVQGGMTALVDKPEVESGVKLWYVQTEEGIEGQGQPTPLAALVEYIELSEVTGERIDEIVSGRSEINGVEQYSREELDAMPEV